MNNIFEIVDNMISATAFPTDNLVKKAINLIQTTQNLNFKGSLSIFKYNDDIYIKAINMNKETLGYLKFNKLYNTSTDMIIDGTFEETTNKDQNDQLPKLLN